MLLSTRIAFQFTNLTSLARDWMIVNVLDDKSKTINFVDLYMKIVEHAPDPLELFVLPEDKKNTPIHIPIGRSQNASDFQVVPLAVKSMMGTIQLLRIVAWRFLLTFSIGTRMWQPRCQHPGCLVK